MSKGRDARVIEASALALYTLAFKLHHFASATSRLSLSVAGGALHFSLCHHVDALLKTLKAVRRKRVEKVWGTSQGVGKSLTRNEREASVRSHFEQVLVGPW